MYRKFRKVQYSADEAHRTLARNQETRAIMDDDNTTWGQRVLEVDDI
jgi:adenine/guanine phosphoribosyltransferase-like PRPP-binding protein